MRPLLRSLACLKYRVVRTASDRSFHENMPCCCIYTTELDTVYVAAATCMYVCMYPSPGTWVAALTRLSPAWSSVVVLKQSPVLLPRSVQLAELQPQQRLCATALAAHVHCCSRKLPFFFLSSRRTGLLTCPQFFVAIAGPVTGRLILLSLGPFPVLPRRAQKAT